jgi:WD40 repeat protein
MVQVKLSSSQRLVLLILSVMFSIAMSGSALAQEMPTFAKITAENAARLMWQRGIGQGGLFNAMWSADGSTLFAITSAGVYGYEPDHIDALPTLVSGNIAYTSGAHFSRDGQWLATVIDEGSKVRITNLTTGEYWTAFEELKSSWAKIYFSDNLVVALSRSNRLWFYDLRQKQVLRVVDALYDLALYPDGMQVAVSDRRGLSLWSLTTLQETARFTPRIANAIRLEFSRDGKSLFTLQVGRTFTAFDVEKRQQKYQLALPVGGFVRYAAQGDTAIVWGAKSEDRGVQVVNLETGKATAFLQATDADSTSNVAVTTASISRDGSRAATLSWDDKLRVWDTVTGNLLDEHSLSYSQFLVFTPDNRKVLHQTASTLVAYDYSTKTSELVPGQYGYNNSDLIFSPNGQQLTVIGSSGVIRYWATGAWDKVTEVPLPAPLNRINHMVYSPDSHMLLVGADKQILRYTMPESAGGTPDPQPFTPLMKATCRRAAYSLDGKLMACSIAQSVIIWDAATNRVLWDYATDASTSRLYVTSVAFSPDSQQLAVAISPNRLDLVNMQDFSVTRHEYSTTEAFFSLTYSPDGKWLAAKSPDNVAHVFDAQTMQQKWSVRGIHRDYDNARQFITFSPDGALVAASDQSQQVRLYEATTGNLVAELKTNTSGEGDYNLRGIVFSPDGTLLAGTTETGMVMLWGVAE